MIDSWVIEWVEKQISPFSSLLQPHKDHDILVQAYREMFQVFIKSIKKARSK